MSTLKNRLSSNAVLVALFIFCSFLLVSCATAEVSNQELSPAEHIEPTPTDQGLKINECTESNNQGLGMEGLGRIERLKTLYNIYVYWNNEFEDGSRWLAQLELAASLLPEEVLREVTEGRYDPCLSVNFKPSGRWYTGQYSKLSNRVTINTTPDPDHPFPYEYLSENGYTDQEILHVWIHEMGHAWHYNVTRYSDTLLTNEPATIYAYYDWTIDRLGDTVSHIENFAESFSLYILLPRYLEKNFPGHYTKLKENVFGGREYTDPPHTPSSIYARLAIK